MDALWRIELLGGLRAVAGTREVTRFQSRQTGYLLAYLGYFSHRAHPREELIEILWPESDPELGRGRLNQAVYSLRRQLTLPGVSGPDVLQSDRETLRLNRAYCATDVAAFEAALGAAKAGMPVERLSRLREAVALYRGELLPGCYGEWCLTERDALADRYLQALHQLTLLQVAEKDLDGALASARRALSMDPLREESHRLLMRVLATAGQVTAALQQYAELERLLREQLRRAPSARARQLAEELRQFQDTSTPGAPPRSPGGTSAGSIPAGIVTFLVADLVADGAPPSPAPGEAAPEGAPPAVTRPEGPGLRESLQPLLAEGSARPLLLRADRARVAFTRATEAAHAALACRTALGEAGMRLRVALHTGETRPSPEDGPDESAQEAGTAPALAFAERLLLSGHPGQTLLSAVTAGLLREEPAAGPEAALTDLGAYRLRGGVGVEHVYQLGAAVSGGEFPPLRAPSGYAGHLPAPASRFVGREPELAELEARLRPGNPGVRSRLWTVTGPGGTGKTRLAQEAAGRLVEAYEGAVWFAALEDANNGEQLLEVVRELLRVERGAGTAVEGVLRALSHQPSLLLLDNFEQIDPSGAAILEELLRRAPGLTALVTSRRRLGLPGEREFPLSPLPVPEPARDPDQVVRSESVRLFLDRAQAVRPDFQVTGHNAGAVAELCRRLEGIPLALELAAARTQVLTPAQMLAQLEQRFRFLSASRPNLSPRHRSMQAALDWGFGLLPPGLRELYARLSVFRGGWTLEAVLGLELSAGTPVDPLDGLVQLRESSLILAEEDGGEMRYRMLEMIRQHAAAKLREQGEDAAWRARHREWYLALAEAAEPELRGPEQARWLDRLDAERENLRAALEGALSAGEAEPALRLAVALCRFWEVRGYLAEGRRLLEAALRQADGLDPLLRARGLNRAGILSREAGDLAAAQAYGAQCLALYQELGDPRGIAYMLNNLGTLARQFGDYPRALALYGESLELQQQRGDEAAAAMLLNNLGCVAQDQGDYRQAREYHEQSLALQWRLEDPGGIALSLHNLADAARWAGSAEEAETWAGQSLALFREIGDRPGAAAALLVQGEAALQRGDAAHAWPLLRESLELFREAADREGVSEALDGIAAAALRTRPREAAVLLSVSEALRERLGSPLPPNVRDQHNERLRAARLRLGDEAFAGAQAEARNLTWEEAAELGLRVLSEAPDGGC